MATARAADTVGASLGGGSRFHPDSENGANALPCRPPLGVMGMTNQTTRLHRSGGTSRRPRNRVKNQKVLEVRYPPSRGRVPVTKMRRWPGSNLTPAGERGAR